MNRKTFGFVSIMVLWLLGSPLPAAETSQTISFSGCDASLADVVDLRFRLFLASIGGTPVFEETQAGVDATTGCFTVQIGSATVNGLPATIFSANPSLWIAFALDDDPDTELGGGRTPVTANGYVFKAVQADRANQATTADQLGGVPATGYLRTSGGSISASNPGPVLSMTNMSTSGAAAGLTAESRSAQGVAGLFVNTAPGGDLIQGKQNATGNPVFRLFNGGGAYFGGNVGIGVANPSATLDVNGSLSVSYVSGRPLFIVSTLTYRQGELTSEVYNPRVESRYTRFKVTGDGNVGIGTASPQNKLHVAGNAGVLYLEGQNHAYINWFPQGLAAGRKAWLGFGGAGTGNFSIENDASGGNILLLPSGNVGIGTFSPQAKLDVAGMTKTNVLQIVGGADLSEKFEVAPTQSQIEPGLVVAIDPHNAGKLVVSAQAYNRRVAGVISGAGGVQTGMLMGQSGTLADGDHPVALSGRVYVWADASNGAIVPGDLLTTANRPGHAMKVTNHGKAQGAILGKAMTGLDQGRGLVLVLVMLQ